MDDDTEQTASGASAMGAHAEPLRQRASLPPTAQLGQFDVFISYRRAHSGAARCLQMALTALGYRVFFDLDRLHGLQAGPFQAQLEQVLASTPVVLVLITPAPSGDPDDKVRFGRSSTETMKEYARLGWTDYCRVEVAMAMAAGKLVIPVYPGRFGEKFIGSQLGQLKGLSDVQGIAGLNAYPLHNDTYAACVHNLHQHIKHTKLRPEPEPEPQPLY